LKYIEQSRILLLILNCVVCDRKKLRSAFFWSYNFKTVKLIINDISFSFIVNLCGIQLDRKIIIKYRRVRI